MRHFTTLVGDERAISKGEIMRLEVNIKNAPDAALFATECAKYDSDIDYVQGRYVVDAKSIIGVIALISMATGVKAEVSINTNNKEEMDRFYESMKLWRVEE